MVLVGTIGLGRHIKIAFRQSLESYGSRSPLCISPRRGRGRDDVLLLPPPPRPVFTNTRASAKFLKTYIRSMCPALLSSQPCSSWPNNSLNFCRLQRGHSPATRHAFIIGKTHILSSRFVLEIVQSLITFNVEVYDFSRELLKKKYRISNKE